MERDRQELAISQTSGLLGLLHQDRVIPDFPDIPDIPDNPIP